MQINKDSFIDGKLIHVPYFQLTTGSLTRVQGRPFYYNRATNLITARWFYSPVSPPSSDFDLVRCALWNETKNLLYLNNESAFRTAALTSWTQFLTSDITDRIFYFIWGSSNYYFYPVRLYRRGDQARSGLESRHDRQRVHGSAQPGRADRAEFSGGNDRAQARQPGRVAHGKGLRTCP